MSQINFGRYIQFSFWGNVDYPDNKSAMLARNAKAKELKKQGYKVTKYTHTNQMRKYDGLGQYNGTIGNVYKIDAYPNNGE